MNKITNPISSSQVTEVSLLKPDCMKNSCGNSLNDWLKFLVDKQCEVDWSQVDLSCLDAYPCKDKDLKYIIEKLIDKVCTLQLTSTGCSGTSSAAVSEPVVFNERWANLETNNPATSHLKDGWVRLSGTITGGSTQVFLFTLHTSMAPTFTKRIPFAHTFNLPNLINEHPFLQITPAGVVSIVWVGSTPNVSLPGNIFLDGVQFKLN